MLQILSNKEYGDIIYNFYERLVLLYKREKEKERNLLHY